MEFSLTISLGNEAMQTAEDVSAALAKIANELSSGWDFTSPTLPGTVWAIKDVNGNRVGEWQVEGYVCGRGCGETFDGAQDKLEHEDSIECPNYEPEDEDEPEPCAGYDADPGL